MSSIRSELIRCQKDGKQVAPTARDFDRRFPCHVRREPQELIAVTTEQEPGARQAVEQTG